MLSKARDLFSSSGESNYPYVTARLRALKTHLLPEEEYPRMIARDPQGIARSLQEGRYKDQIDEYASEYSGAQLVERATWRNLGEEFQRILSWCKGDLERMLGLYFQRFVVANLKTLLRGAQADADREERESALIPVGLVSRDDMNAALNTSSLEECLEVLSRGPYGDVLQENEDERLPVIENALDKAYYERLVASVEPNDRPKKAYLRFLRREIDGVNLRTVFRAKHAGVADFQFVEGGGEIDEELARQIHGGEWSEIPAILEETPYGDRLRDAIETYRETGSLDALTRRLESLQIEEADEFAHLYPLSILPIIDYVLNKEREVDRLRMIAFGKQADMSREEIEDLVIE